jgi:hypothetical protein
MSLELESYKVLSTLAKRLTPDTTTHMLEILEPCVSLAEKTAVYATALKRFRRGDYPPTNTVCESIDRLKKIQPKIDYNTVFWLIGLRIATDTHDFEFVEAQIGMFLAGQKADFFRVENDKLRLCLTYMYFKLTATLLKNNIL